MQIFINDTSTECRENITLIELLSQQGIQPLNIAIAMDNTVIPKTLWKTTIVKDGCNIIIIRAVQGG